MLRKNLHGRDSAGPALGIDPRHPDRFLRPLRDGTISPTRPAKSDAVGSGKLKTRSVKCRGPEPEIQEHTLRRIVPRKIE